MRAGGAHFPNDLCTCFSAQFSVPLSFVHVCESRTSKKQNFVLEASSEDSGGSEVRIYATDICTDVRRSPSSLPGTAGCWVVKGTRAVHPHNASRLPTAVTPRLPLSTPSCFGKILSISKSFCLCVSLYQCSLLDKLQVRTLKYFLVIYNNILPVNITDFLMKNSSRLQKKCSDFFCKYFKYLSS